MSYRPPRLSPQINEEVVITSMKTLWSCLLLSALGLGMTGCELDRSGDPADDADEVAPQGDVEPFFTNGRMW